MIDWRLISKWTGIGFIVAGFIGHFYRGFDYSVLGLYILGVLFFLSWWVPKRILKRK